MPIIRPVAASSFHLILNSLYNTFETTKQHEGNDAYNHMYHAALAPRKLGSSNSAVTLAAQEKLAIQLVATLMASLSITAALIALYWFCLMRRNYRRDLVLTLIVSDVFKNFCYILFAGVNMNNPVQSEDPFCQASGYLLQTGLEASDLAIFFLSLHMLLQIFPLPNTVLGYDGLYNVRYYVYFLWFALPNVTASLAFINSEGGYQVQGAWCWLPVRPFWYRLALAWIPRYVITIAILCMALTIYLYVGTEFRIFGHERARASSAGLSSSTEATQRNISTPATVVAPEPPAVESTPAAQDAKLLSFGDLSHAPDQTLTYFDLSKQTRRHSVPAWTSPFDNNPIDSSLPHHVSQSTSTSRRGSRQVAFERDIIDEPVSPLQRPADKVPPSIATRTEAALSLRSITSVERPVTNLLSLRLSKTDAPDTAHVTMDKASRSRRRAIKRQVRGLFIYPVAYMLFWIIPFILHCMNYSDYYAHNPVFPVSLLASFCTTTLGLVDVIIFCWREQPWRHIAGNDGSFFGSFCFWRFKNKVHLLQRTATSAEDEEKDIEYAPGVIGLLQRLRRRRRRLSSGAGRHSASPDPSTISKTRRSGADRDVRDRELVQQRLQMEREEFERKHRGRTHSSGGMPPARRNTGARNWFDELLVNDEESPSARKKRSIV